MYKRVAGEKGRGINTVVRMEIAIVLGWLASFGCFRMLQFDLSREGKKI